MVPWVSIKVAPNISVLSVGALLIGRYKNREFHAPRSAFNRRAPYEIFREKLQYG